MDRFATTLNPARSITVLRDSNRLFSVDVNIFRGKEEGERIYINTYSGSVLCALRAHRE